MRRLPISALALTWALTGCSGDPASSRLKQGSEAITYRSAGAIIIGMHDIGIGTKVRVISDEEDFHEEPRQVAGNAAGDGRRIQVRVLEGEHAGYTGSLERHELRPIRN